uniref:Uncharacterized protein n=1 Tax=Acrobeloides nanus TaxID=290746 RepID=A0A914C5K3_9BILA
MGHTVQQKPFPNQVHNQPSNSQGMQPIQPLAFQHNQGNNVAHQNNNNQARQDIPIDNTPITHNMVEKLNEAVNETRGNEEKALMEDIVKIYESSGGTRVQKWDQVVSTIESSKLSLNEKQKLYQIVANATSV